MNIQKLGKNWDIPGVRDPSSDWEGSLQGDHLIGPIRTSTTPTLAATGKLSVTINHAVYLKFGQPDFLKRISLALRPLGQGDGEAFAQ